MDNFNEKVVENLKNEIECLNHSLTKARQDGNFSMYKNLINSYRETVMLINELSGNNLKVKSSVIQTPEKIILQVENGTITNENNDIILSKNGVPQFDDYKIKCAIEKEIEEGINKIDCYRERKLIDVKANKFIDDEYDVVIKFNSDVDLSNFKLKINNIISNMPLKNFIDKVLLVRYIGNSKYSNVVFRNDK
ncbi:hypothetical protein [Clostridium sporogenes]|uniref:hypothetical protein n=1 Tax=Clostridium sporogenes TaxID=1509 RepID=UPI0013D543EC|nr:hypothetical protein [Clostridium sporogenes]NFH40705.1 hypothetical protein [Clostridium sporogenes]